MAYSSWKKGIRRSNEFTANKILTYHISDKTADVYVEKMSVNEGSYLLNVSVEGKVMQALELNMGGMHNIENMLAAIATGRHLGINDEAIKAAVKSFRGVKRRFETVLKK